MLHTHSQNTGRRSLSLSTPIALPLAAHRVSFLLLPARLELGSRRCSPGLEEDDKTTEL